MISLSKFVKANHGNLPDCLKYNSTQEEIQEMIDSEQVTEDDADQFIYWVYEYDMAMKEGDV